MNHTFAVRIFAVILVLLACEALARLGLGLFHSQLEQDWRLQVLDYEDLLASGHDRVVAIVSGRHDGYIEMDSDLGWSIRPGGEFEQQQEGGGFATYRANSQGIRSSYEYNVSPDKHKARIAVFGDSFSHADDVPNDSAWTAILEESSANLEVLNFGVPGYGTDQALLRYRNVGTKFSPDISILGVMSENLNRNLNVFIPFYRHESWPATKPRFLLNKNGELELLSNPYPQRDDFQELIDNPSDALEKLGADDWWYNAKYKPGIMDNLALYRAFHYGYILLRYPWLLDSQVLYNRASEHYRLLLGIIRTFVKEARENNAIPVILLFPSLDVLTRQRLTGEYMYSPLVEDLEAGGIPYVDLLEGFKKYGKDFHGPQIIPKHYSETGNRIAARYLGEELDGLISQVLSDKQLR